MESNIKNQLDLPFDPPYMSLKEAEAWTMYCREHDLEPGQTWADLPEATQVAYLDAVEYCVRGD